MRTTQVTLYGYDDLDHETQKKVLVYFSRIMDGDKNYIENHLRNNPWSFTKNGEHIPDFYIKEWEKYT
jgi:hypothetical protein